ncbi:MAG: FeoA domain-containing protein [Gemmatimonadetes bacterium]|nr:FeoA domain-containing protein [Gemmatimonadota bacterium]
MLRQLLRRRTETKAAAAPRCGACPLAACATGCRAAVLQMECAGDEANRLRNMGLFEGACVTVVDSRNGMLLDVKGARLALGAALASAIRVLPLGS